VLISQILAGKGAFVATIPRDATVADTVDELHNHGVGALVVSSDGTHIDGIVSERDVVRWLYNQRRASLDEPVVSIMSSRVFTCTPEDDTESLMAVMTELRIRHVPVVEDGVLRGIVSIGDVIKSTIDGLQKDRKELFDYINGR
jgi:CBS domain-containing protein